VPIVSSDPHAWLRPIYRQLAAERAFEQLAPVMKFQRLVEAAAVVSERGAALLKRASPAAQSGLLAHLAMMEAQRPAQHSEEL